MARAATSRLKCNPPLGRMPVLQFMAPAELAIDASYQRDIAGEASQALIRKIAQHWNWDLCLPLVVSRRDGQLFVIDGQHRLEAAKLRRDIMQLPCVVVEYASAADEAASFVHLNQQRRPLSKLDVFKAAVASEDPEACAILRALEDAGLSVAPHQNYISWKPGMVSNIGGIESAWRKHGEAATRDALRVLARAFKGEKLRYAGTIFPGIVALRAAQGEGAELGVMAQLLGERSQVSWRSIIMAAKIDNPNLKYGAASALALARAWEATTGTPSLVRVAGLNAERVLVAQTPSPGPIEGRAADPRGALNFVTDRPVAAGGDGKAWCDQCEMRVTLAEAEGCKSRWCSLRTRSAA
ncbi:ParB N-terminal domain-containing protein [Qipengyuania sp. 6B39]|uniref:DUF6551 family protein n=1 Tax=Qipengyuania proteolytica TaxID=2867239 RepID=UPI001C898747|nr:DUF6551 family protein [Qipengyuania proteolytica]MBX7496784.1 ParB N-terminal domain-containing protein [Qipengyuania proteolytica]